MQGFIINAPVQRVRMRIQNTVEALFVFKRPLARTTRQYFADVRPRFRTEGSDLKFLPAEKSHAQQIMRDHLEQVLQIPGLEPFPESIEQIKDMLCAPQAQGALNSLVTSLFFTEPMELVNDDPQSAKASFGSLFAAHPVILGMREWDDEGVQRNDFIRVVMEAPTATQQRELEAAQPLVRQRKGDMEQREDVGKCQQLFAARVREIDGAFYHPMNNADVEPLPCSAETRGEWVSMVPYHVVASVFNEEQIRGSVGNG